MDWGERNTLIANREFSELFYGQGFDDVPAGSQSIELSLSDDEYYTATVIVQKRGFAVCVCEDDDVINLTRAQKNKLLRQLARSHYEHLLILCGKDNSGQEKQQWLVSIRPQNRPLRIVEVEWREEQGQLLQEKLAGLIFPLKEEETLTINDVVERVRNAFVVNSEAVTKKFYNSFKQELKKFDTFISGIQNTVDKKQYAALMLNRLMFIYFIQKKEFLDGELDYLNNRLQRVQKDYGKNQFHNKFYREFLRRLFKDGLDTPIEQRDSEVNALIGKVPYLNGGLFDAHKLETENTDINIPDEAFIKLFAFFDKYQWHLDNRPTASGNEINPDVLGYIFEKYINDRADMGAYYTQEDITEYIAKNTILPYLLQQAKQGCSTAFDADNGIWRFLSGTPDNYIHDAVKHGCNIADNKIPLNIRNGIEVAGKNLIERRQDWNTPASENFALPTETWREAIARRQRYIALRQKMTKGEISRIEDLITHNIDIMRFVRDALSHYEGSDFIKVFFSAIAGIRHTWRENTKQDVKRGISILDPSCGSGAFLFAALNILQPLYEVCVDRMREFVEDDDRKIQERGGRKKHLLFRRVLAEIKNHPNTKYWIYKTIILENLYGVDIMVEAAEIAKLRLFLQLAAVAEYDSNKENLGLEPLPDIDYNIRAGNSLVGFSNMRKFEDIAGFNLDNDLINKVRNQAEAVAKANDAFRAAQDSASGGYVAEKRKLAEKLEQLNETLNHYLAKSAYDINYETHMPEYQQWKKSHTPFHWLAEFYGIVEENKGFDVVIGNPPYVEYRTIDEYAIRNYTTEKCGNLYAYFIELCDEIIRDESMVGMIVPISLPSTARMNAARQLLERNSTSLHISNYGDRPASLFMGVHQKVTIFIRQKGKSNSINYTTKFMRWNKTSRKYLFDTLNYLSVENNIMRPEWKKYNSPLEIKIRKKILNYGMSINSILLPKPSQSQHNCIYLNKRLMHWVKCSLNKQESNEFEVFYPIKNITAEQCMALFNSNVFFWFWETIGDCWHLIKRDYASFKVNLPDFIKDKKILSVLGKELNADLENKKVYIGSVQTEYEYKHKLSKPIIDKIDMVLSRHYGFTDEELDYIINYCYKYRLGLSNEE